MKFQRLRRSRLYMPGNNPYLSQNAFLFGADCIILDLEDSVPPSEKFDTRILVREILKNVDFGGTEKTVRINQMSSPFGRDDLEESVPALPDAIFIPKTESADDVLIVDEIVAEIKSKHDIDKEIFYMPIIESAKGVWNAYEIASASPNVVMLTFGAEDFTRDIGAQRTREGKEQFVAKSMVVLGAKAAGIQASDTVWSDIDDIEGLRNSTLEAKELGFDGKGAIHPSQVEIINEIFNPTHDEIEYAKKVVSAFEEAQKKGNAVVALGRKMLDPPVVARAQRIIELAEKIGKNP
ncbi:HpcH/HpaI aldolase/citrate lyase family protein [bacterium]|nr:HpcH/HpaI aldolase/citrate lyase family protein [bacterium]